MQSPSPTMSKSEQSAFDRPSNSLDMSMDEVCDEGLVKSEAEEVHAHHPCTEGCSTHSHAATTTKEEEKDGATSAEVAEKKEGGNGDDDVSAQPVKPARWVSDLLSGRFFAGCSCHSELKKNECTFFCLECAGESLCQYCLPDHAGHTQLQIRRYVYHDVVRLQDIHKFIETQGVQTYIINSARVMFLNQRPQSRPVKGPPGDSCETCDRGLREGFRFCSVACKVESMCAEGQDPCAMSGGAGSAARGGGVVGKAASNAAAANSARSNDSDLSDSDTTDAHRVPPRKRRNELDISMHMPSKRITVSRQGSYGSIGAMSLTSSGLAYTPPSTPGCCTPRSARRKGTPLRAPMW